MRRLIRLRPPAPLLRSCAAPPRPLCTASPRAPIDITTPAALRSLPRWSLPQSEPARLEMEHTMLTGSSQRWEVGKERRFAEFGSSKQWKTMSFYEAESTYLLRRRDLEGLPYVAKFNVYGNQSLVRFYVIFDVQDAALSRWGTAEALADELRKRQATRERRIARLQPPVLMLLRPVRARKGHVVVGDRAVRAAILGNVGVLSAKVGAFMATGSAAMLSEAFHSLADLGNQCLLAVGLQRSLRPADSLRPYGYGFDQFVWSTIAAVSTFILGAGASVYHGVHTLLHPQPLLLDGLPAAMGVLLAAGVLESYTLSVAWSEMKREADKLEVTPWQYLTSAPDPLNPAVLLEDSVAVIGVGIAGTSILLTHVTGQLVWDAVGSIAVGGLLGAVAVFVINKNIKFLGQTPALRTDAVVAMLRADNMVLSVQDVKSVMVSPQVARFKAEIHFNPQLLSRKYLSAHNNLSEVHRACKSVDSEAEAQVVFERYGTFLMATLSLEVDRLEHMITEAYPEFKYIDLEVL